MKRPLDAETTTTERVEARSEPSSLHPEEPGDARASRLCRALLAAGALAIAGCGATTPASDAGGGAGGGGARATGGGAAAGGGTATGAGGGGATGGGGGATDAGTASAHTATNVVAGAGRLTGGTFIMNAQVGQGVPQGPVTGGGRVIGGNTAIKR